LGWEAARISQEMVRLTRNGNRQGKKAAQIPGGFSMFKSNYAALDASAGIHGSS
jgi:hypothetical protein